MMYSNVIVGITISRGSFVFSQSRVKVSASLTDVGNLAVRAFDVVNCSVSVAGFVLVFNVGQQVGHLLLLTNLTCYQCGGNDTARISSLKYYLGQRPLQQPPTDALVRLAELDLNLNSFEFNNAYYHQVGGL